MEQKRIATTWEKLLPTNEQRIPYIDTIKGVLIIWIVWLHTFTTPEWASVYLRLPFFFFISGFFIRLDTDFKSFLTKRINGLLIPYLFFYLIGFAYTLPQIIWGIGDKGADILQWKLLYQWILPERLPFNYPIWFLFTLFEIHLLLYALKKIVRQEWIVSALLLITSILYLLFAPIEQLPDNYKYFILHSFWLSLGYTLKKYGKERMEITSRWGIDLLLYLILFMILHSSLSKTPDSLWELPACLFFFGFILRLFEKLCELFSFRLLRYIGQNSLIVLGMHSVILNLQKLFIEKSGGEITITWGIIITFATILALLPVIHLLNRWLPSMVGKRPLLKIQKRP